MPLNIGNVPSYLILETEAEPRRVFWGPKGKKVARACCQLDFQFQREGPGLCMRLGNVWRGEGDDPPEASKLGIHGGKDGRRWRKADTELAMEGEK